MKEKKDIVLYFSPHQDDELLSMGDDICRTCLLPNKEVHVVLCTDGSKSPARQRLNSENVCPIHNNVHKYNLSVEDFIQARDSEFLSSCKALGVSPENIHIYEKRAIDGSLSFEYAQEIIKHFISIYGKNVEVRTCAPFNSLCYQHKDHYNLGLAAKQLLKEKLFLKAKFFIEGYYMPKGLNRYLSKLLYIIKKEDCSQQEKEILEKALQLSYGYWNPAEKRYSVGYHCVPKMFEHHKKNMSNFYISPRFKI